MTKLRTLFPIMYSLLNKKKIICSVTIWMMCIVGDKNSTPRHGVDLAAAILDNMTHAIIGMLTWFGVLILETPAKSSNIYPEILLCGFCSSIIDLDHFLSAKSFNLQDAVSLSKRPVFHCTTGTLFVSSIILLSAVMFNFSWLYRFGWILIAAFLSHHIRDSTRRGFWLWPFGSTKPIPYNMYLLFEFFLPDVIYLFSSCASVGSQRTPESSSVINV